MCGIIGIIAKDQAKGLTYKYNSVFSDMLCVDILRGEDSTGMYLVNKYGNVEWAKSADNPFDFINNYKAKSFINSISYNTSVVVGHNRKATRGVIKDENAHPFVEDNIILVHNGTLHNHKELNNTVEVDSHAIAHAIKEHGIKKAISKIDGAFAVATYDIDKREFYLFRNKERPLWVAETEDAWVFASEPWIAFGMCWRHGEIIKEKTLHEIKPAELYTFNLKGDKVTLKKTEVSLYEPKKPEVAIYSFPKTQNTGNSTTNLTGAKAWKTFQDSFKKDNFVVFKPVKIDHENYSNAPFFVEGKHYLYDNVTIRCRCSVGLYDFLDKQVLLEKEYLVAVISGIGFNSTTNAKTVYCFDPSESIPLVTLNGTLINEEQLQNLSLVCHKCNKDIDEDEIEDSYVKFKKTGVIHICSKCVEENLAINPMWGGIIKDEVANYQG